MESDIVYQDNTSLMRLETNGRTSASKMTRHFNIKYFYVTDLIQQKELKIKYCPTNQMIADFQTKPLVGEAFLYMKRMIMNPQ